MYSNIHDSTVSTVGIQDSVYFMTAVYHVWMEAKEVDLSPGTCFIEVPGSERPMIGTSYNFILPWLLCINVQK